MVSAAIPVFSKQCMCYQSSNVLCAITNNSISCGVQNLMSVKHDSFDLCSSGTAMIEVTDMLKQDPEICEIEAEFKKW